MRREWKEKSKSQTAGGQRDKCGAARGEWRKGGTSGKWRQGIRKAAALWGLAVALLSLSGCQLAKEVEIREQDVLCGILVTTREQEDACREAWGEAGTKPESLVLTEKELLQMKDGANIRFPQDEPGIQVEGLWQESGDIVFKGLEGASLLAGCRRQDEAGEYLHFTSTGVMTDMKADSSTTDTGEFNRVEGTVSVCQNAVVTVHMNPVYQRPEGSIYAILGGAGGFWNSGKTSPGGVYSQSYKEEQKKRVDGKEISTGQEFTVRLAVDVETTSVTVKEWDAGDGFLGETTVKRGQEHFTLQETAEYFMVEERRGDGLVERSVYTWDEEKSREGMLNHTVFYGNDYGLLEPALLSFEKR